MLKIYTSNFEYWETGRLDVSVSTGITAFAPNPDSKWDYKDKKYTKNKYYEKMRESYKNRRDLWDWLLQQKKIVLVCDCTIPERCHRFWLADILEKLGAEYHGEIEAKND